MSNDFLCASESVSEGCADKVADQTSDAILDDIFPQAAKTRLALEILCNTERMVLADGIATNGYSDNIQVARNTPYASAICKIFRPVLPQAAP